MRVKLSKLKFITLICIGPLLKFINVKNFSLLPALWLDTAFFVPVFGTDLFFFFFLAF